MSSNNSGVVTLKQKALEEAISQLGQQEEAQHDNKGVMVDEYLKAVGLNPGYSWCMAFFYWCYKTASETMHSVNPVVKTAGVLDCWNRTAVQFKYTKLQVASNPSLIEPGDQFIMKEGTTTGHTGMIEKVDGDMIHTIEGNSNDNGSREGYMVVRHARKIDDIHILGYIKYS